MRLFKQQRKISFNWKYVLGEVMLIFFGITLAVWFNNWNADRKANQEKAVAMVRIEEELRDNLEELQNAQKENRQLVELLMTCYSRTDGLTMSPAKMNRLRMTYPDMLLIEDSTAEEAGQYRYEATLNATVEIPEITQIAWETTQTIGVTSAMDYRCLYEIEKVYNLQRLLQKELDAVLEALRQQDTQELANLLNFSRQYYPKLEEAYQKTLNQLNDCD